MSFIFLLSRTHSRTLYADKRVHKRPKILLYEIINQNLFTSKKFYREFEIISEEVLILHGAFIL